MRLTAGTEARIRCRETWTRTDSSTAETWTWYEVGGARTSNRAGKIMAMRTATAPLTAVTWTSCDPTGEARHRVLPRCPNRRRPSSSCSERRRWDCVAAGCDASGYPVKWSPRAFATRAPIPRVSCLPSRDGLEGGSGLSSDGERSFRTARHASRICRAWPSFGFACSASSASCPGPVVVALDLVGPCEESSVLPRPAGVYAFEGLMDFEGCVFLL